VKISNVFKNTMTYSQGWYVNRTKKEQY
jgi:hypothetical protein